eukprot:COSAG04_NODE_230_length_19216_cov_15.830787_3_plen_106_part_00
MAKARLIPQASDLDLASAKVGNTSGRPVCSAAASGSDGPTDAPRPRRSFGSGSNSAPTSGRDQIRPLLHLVLSQRPRPRQLPRLQELEATGLPACCLLQRRRRPP